MPMMFSIRESGTYIFLDHLHQIVCMYVLLQLPSSSLALRE